MTLVAASTPGILWGVDWLVVTALATVGTVLVLLVTAGLALRQLRLNREVHEDQVRPHVVIDIVPGGTTNDILELSVKNHGLTAARNVRITMTPPVVTTLDGDGQYALRNSNLLTGAVPTIAPGREIRTLFDSMPARHEAGLQMRYTAQAAYEDRRGRCRIDTFELDLSVLLSLMYIEKKGEHQIAVALEKIAASLKKWTHAERGLRVMAQPYEKFAWEKGTLTRHAQKGIRMVLALLRYLSRGPVGPVAMGDPPQPVARSSEALRAAEQ